MSVHLLGRIEFPSQLPSATAPYFLLGLNSAGAWVIREATGRRAGVLARPAAQHDGHLRAADGRAAAGEVLGYPAGWPAGPWVVPLFWLAVLLGVWLWRWVGWL